MDIYLIRIIGFWVVYWGLLFMETTVVQELAAVFRALFGNRSQGMLAELEELPSVHHKKDVETSG